LEDESQRKIIIDKLLNQLKVQQTKKRKPRKPLIPVPESPSPSPELSPLKTVSEIDISLRDQISTQNGGRSHVKAA